MRNARTAFDDERPEGVAATVLAIVRKRPIDTFAGVLAAACTGMILLNALFLQQGRHPSPFFGAVEQPAPPPAAPRRSELVEQVQLALADRGYYEGAPDGLMGARTAAAIRTFEQAERLPVTGEASERLLAAALTALKRQAEAAPAAPPAAIPAPAPRAAAQKPATPAVTGSTALASPKLMAVQRALAKLGYGPVTIDGKMGAETRNALISFERDRDMPATGEPSPPVLRALQAMSGTPFE